MLISFSFHHRQRASLRARSAPRRFFTQVFFGVASSSTVLPPPSESESSIGITSIQYKHRKSSWQCVSRKEIQGRVLDWGLGVVGSSLSARQATAKTRMVKQTEVPTTSVVNHHTHTQGRLVLRSGNGKPRQRASST